jgi:adenylate cyclase
MLERSANLDPGVNRAAAPAIDRPRRVDTYVVPSANPNSGSSGEQLARDIQRRMALKGWLTSGIGALVVCASVGLMVPIFLDSDERLSMVLLNVPIALACFVLTGIGITMVSYRYCARAFPWLIEGRAPNDHEYRLTLKLPEKGALITAGGWGCGVLLFTALNLHYSPGFALAVGTTIWLGGETTSALNYLMDERNLRPITARALAAHLPEKPVTPGVRGRLLIAWVASAVPVLGLLLFAMVGLTNADVDTDYLAAMALFLGLVTLAVGLVATLFVARAVADPVNSLRRAFERVEAGDLEAQVPVDDSSEIGLLQAGFNRMAEGLREREQLRELFGRQVGKDVARAALLNGTKLGGEEREVGVLFVDVTGSTSMALAMPPTEVVRLLNLFFRVVVEEVEAGGGIVNKFEGDAALCVFGAPVANHDSAGRALRTARSLRERLSREVPQLDFGIGVSAGPAVAGNVGAEHRFEYTVIGDPVNEAARLSELAKERGQQVLASSAALGRAQDGECAAWALGDSAVLRGRGAPTGLATPVA